MSHVQRLELCGQSQPPHNPSDQGEQHRGLGKEVGLREQVSKLGTRCASLHVSKGS